VAPEATVHLSDDLALLHRKYLLDCNVSLLFVSVEALQGRTAQPMTNSSAFIAPGSPAGPNSAWLRQLR
jgi:hypothetical protein